MKGKSQDRAHGGQRRAEAKREQRGDDQSAAQPADLFRALPELDDAAGDLRAAMRRSDGSAEGTAGRWPPVRRRSSGTLDRPGDRACGCSSLAVPCEPKIWVLWSPYWNYTRRRFAPYDRWRDRM
jgi:hypothetical protein